MFSEASREKRQNEHVPMPQTPPILPARSVFSGGEPATRHAASQPGRPARMRP
ncbi:hypothetical protein B0T18DRAFT_418128 [Schizothecium vesticola]|uniref:Uncharacterized protein n=1 Tax=Schizothecium vesticola TaxID=314040 RepID=A0AA40EJJ3_9PEZI|nr:hypothetical protein B0T18DRAFT_418128 [Schizothecium vesticola]